MTKFIISAFADEYSDDIESQVQVLHKYGIKYLELRHANGKNVSQMTDSDVCGIAKLLRSEAIGVSSIGSPLGKIRLDEDLHAHYETAKKLFDFANKLGTKYCRVFSFYAPQGEKIQNCKQQVMDAVGKLLDIAREYGITLCHENEALIYGESPDSCKELLDSFSNLRAVFDMGNFVLDGYDSKVAYDKLSSYVQYFHIKDALGVGAVVPAGKGEANIGEILSKYSANNGADTFVTIEPHLQTFDGLNALVGKSFDNPYKYENQQQAFCDGVEKFLEVMKKCNLSK